MEAGKYVVIDGMDGSGKGTQLKLLQQRYCNAVFTREPGGTPFAEEIRKLVRDNPLAGQSTPLNNFLLFWAAREELMHNAIMPALKAGKTVFSDRGDSSTFAFQICGELRRSLKPLFSALREQVFHEHGRRAPDLYIVLDLSPEVSEQRALLDATRTQTHFDTRGTLYYRLVREGFREFSRNYPNVSFVDANGSVEEVHNLVRMVLESSGVVP